MRRDIPHRDVVSSVVIQFMAGILSKEEVDDKLKEGLLGNLSNQPILATPFS